MRKVKSPGRKATGRTSASARKAKLTLPTLTLGCTHDAYELCRHCAPSVAERHYLREAFEALSDREKCTVAGQRRIILPDQTLTTDGKPIPSDIELEAELEEQVMQRMRETRPQQDPLGMLSTLQALQPRNALDYERPGRPPIVAGSRKPPKHSPYIGTAAAEHLTLACEHGTNECCPHCIPKATQRTAFRKAIDKQNAQAIDAQIAKSAVQTSNSIASDVRLLYAAARKLTPHAPEHDADIPYAVIVRECPHLPALLTRLGYDPQQGYIPADLRGIAEYLQMPKGEPSEAQCALRLLELGFDIVRKGTTKKATRAELERAIARERPNAKK